MFSGFDGDPSSEFWVLEMKSNLIIFRLLLLVAVCFCMPVPANCQLSDVPWKAAEQIQKRGNNKVEFNDEGFVTKILMEDIPGGFVMGQLEVFPHLESVSIDSRYYFEDSNMGGVRKLKSMKAFAIKNSRDASSSLLEMLAEAPALEELTIENCSEMSSLHELTRIRRLKHLTIVPDDALSFLPLVECRNLKTLRLFKSESIDDTAMGDISRVESLETIDLSQTSITDEGLAQLGKLPNLQSLTLKKCNNISGDAFAAFEHPDAMKSINLEQARSLNDVGLAELQRFKNLEHLRLHLNRKIAGQGFRCLESMKQLKTLWCPNTTIADEHLRLLDGIESLELIWLPACPRVSGRGLDCLAGSANCTILSLNDCRLINSPDIDVIAKFKNLGELYVGRTRVRNEGIEKLCQLEKLRILNIEGNNWLGDIAFEKLKDSSIEKLEARGLPRLTDKCLVFANQMKNLTDLSITANSELGGVGFGALRENERIKRITIQRPEFLKLEAFSYLKEVPNLEELQFSEGQIALAQLEQLAGMKRLKRLKYKIDDSMSSSERLIAILKAFPQLNQ